LLNEGESVCDISVPIDDKATIYDDRRQFQNPKTPRLNYTLIRRRETAIERFALSLEALAHGLCRAGRIFGEVIGKHGLKAGRLVQAYETHGGGCCDRMRAVSVDAHINCPCALGIE
jgi:hypothetical protein